MNELDDFAVPVRLRTIVISFVLALLLDLMPFPFEMFFWLPEWTALTLLYWSLHRPQWSGMGVAFVLGLLVDVGTAASLGLHALSYTVMVFFVLRYRRQIMLYGYAMQIFAVLAALLCNQTVLVAARLFLNHQIITWHSLLAPVSGALVWPLFSQILMMFSASSRRIR
ncbi:rod shape-determining protein MreD [Neisseria animalis]|uniref:Rod shape-determining protein MreD n=1 Tax=Neisseria animalis TaxID=492 RepID=A0A5P3MRW4_NEIAN|nr:rod shape-determining protein MreD [Neisseria animalis]QEY24347.1 rod shape-determining protein MreD [Neisseria animalis]ROW31746.1 rod shape-determining protein MreD [Neisseria animalis]VEE06840.1 Rod shape-determining protein mreD [Neisseria animalis]